MGAKLCGENAKNKDVPIGDGPLARLAARLKRCLRECHKMLAATGHEMINSSQRINHVSCIEHFEQRLLSKSLQCLET